MGDYAFDIAKTAKKLADKEPIKPLVKIPRMAEIVRRMLHESLQAFVNHDMAVISEVAREDDEVRLGGHSACQGVALWSTLNLLAPNPSRLIPPFDRS